MTVSVIIPTYNRTRLLLDRALPSVWAQTDPDFEVIVVGDGTEDATGEELAQIDDDRLSYINLPHTQYPEDPKDRWGLVGLVPINFGLDRAVGEWIAVLGDDDEFTPDHNEVLLAFAAETGADHVYGMSDTDRRHEGEADGLTMYGAWPPGIAQFCNGANLYRASLGYRYDMTCRSRGLNGDEDLWVRMIADGVTFAFLPRIVHHYHQSSVYG